MLLSFPFTKFRRYMMKDILKYIEINAFILFFLTFLILLFLINCTFVIFVVTLNQYYIKSHNSKGCRTTFVLGYCWAQNKILLINFMILFDISFNYNHFKPTYNIKKVEFCPLTIFYLYLLSYSTIFYYIIGMCINQIKNKTHSAFILTKKKS